MSATGADAAAVPPAPGAPREKWWNGLFQGMRKVGRSLQLPVAVLAIGLLTAVTWQRFHRTRLVDWLGFFNGRRPMPILMAFRRS